MLGVEAHESISLKLRVVQVDAGALVAAAASARLWSSAAQGAAPALCAPSQLASQRAEMMNILLGGMAGDGPPEPPPPRTKDARIVLSWFSVAAGTMLLLSRIESSFLQDAPPDEDRLQLAWRLVKHLSIPGILGSLLVLHGLSRLAARGKRRQAARLGLLSAALLAFASLSKLGVLHQANAKVALPGLGLLILVAWTAVGKVLGGEDDEEEEDARGGREGPADARAAAIDKDGSVVHHSGAAVGGAGGARARSGAAAGPATTSGQ